MKQITKEIVLETIETYKKLLELIENEDINIDEFITNNYLYHGICFHWYNKYNITYYVTHEKLGSPKITSFFIVTSKEKRIKVTKERIKLLKTLI